MIESDDVTTTSPAPPKHLQHQQQQPPRKVQSMITVRKDYSYKYTKPKTPSTAPISTTQEKLYNCLGISQNLSQSNSEQQPQLGKKETHSTNNAKPSSNKQHHHHHHQKPLIAFKPKEVHKRLIKPNISILERHDYRPKVIKLEKTSEEDRRNSYCAIDDIHKSTAAPKSCSSSSSSSSSSIENLKSNNVPIGHSSDSKENIKRKEYCERDKLKVIVAQEEAIESSPVNVKQEYCESPTTSLRQPTLSTESSKDSQNINKINNKINIIFQLNDNTKSLRKNIILHRRTPKKMVQKITIKEANNNSTNKNQSDCEATLVPENKILCTIETQTEEEEESKRRLAVMHMSTTNPLSNEITEYLFFEKDAMISLQSNTISFFAFNQLGCMLKKGETDFRLIARIARRLHDEQVDGDNKLQRLCYNDLNPLPIYVEMRAKQKELDDPEMCPIAFLYCNIYYIDNANAKFSSVHLDTVKSVVGDIKYTTVPDSSYFIMSWHENALDTKGSVTGLVKYKLTPNLDLARLASIRQFPKLDYRIKQMYCGKGM
jgi:hypothetical protein